MHKQIFQQSSTCRMATAKVPTAKVRTEGDLVREIEKLLVVERELTDQVCKGGCLQCFDSEAQSVKKDLRKLPVNDSISAIRARRLFGNALVTCKKSNQEEAFNASSEGTSDSVKTESNQVVNASSSSEGTSDSKAEENETRGSKGFEVEEKMRKNLELRARFANKAEDMILDLLFLRWSEHKKKLDKFLRTEAKPPIYYSFAKQLEEEDPASVENRKVSAFEKWKKETRLELDAYGLGIHQKNVASIQRDWERWLDKRKT